MTDREREARAAFEAQMWKDWHPVMRRKDNGDYLDAGLQLRWDIWQAACTWQREQDAKAEARLAAKEIKRANTAIREGGKHE